MSPRRRSAMRRRTLADRASILLVPSGAPPRSPTSPHPWGLLLARLTTHTAGLSVLMLIGLGPRLFLLDTPPAPMFDEGIFYLPAARAYLGGLPDPNFEHPPLGKLSIAAGIAVLGDNAWGWRVTAALAGTAGILLTYRLAWILWRSRLVALLAGVLLSADLLWLAFSRLALLDIFQAVLALAALGFAWRYRSEQRGRDLVATGICVGLAAAVKWSGVWALLPVGLALLPEKLDLRGMIGAFRRGTIVASAAVAGYLVPWLYQLGMLGEGPDRLATRHLEMFRYQTAAGTAATPLLDRLAAPLVWLLNLPLLFTSSSDPGAWLLVMSNPLVFWPGVVAMVWLSHRAAGSLRSPEAFVVAAALSFYLPWFAIARLKYSYYLLPVVPLLAIALARALGPALLDGDRTPNARRRRLLAIAYLAVTVAVFIGRYPAVAGIWRR